MKLELKHIGPYLPYELQLLEEFETNENKVRTLRGIELDMLITNLERFPFNQRVSYYEVKPILHPMSDLTKYIDCPDVMGEAIIPSRLLYELYGGGYNSYEAFELNFIDNIRLSDYKNLEYQLIQFLAKYHFDFQNLIEQGLAIDINTL